MEQISKINWKKILEPDGVHPTDLKGLKDELAEIIITVRGFLFKTDLELSMNVSSTASAFSNSSKRKWEK